MLAVLFVWRRPLNPSVKHMQDIRGKRSRLETVYAHSKNVVEVCTRYKGGRSIGCARASRYTCVQVEGMGHSAVFDAVAGSIRHFRLIGVKRTVGELQDYTGY